jgi:hypothetical protein
LSFVPTEGKLSLLLHARVTDPVVHTTPCSLTHTLFVLCAHRSATVDSGTARREALPRARRSDQFHDPLIGFGSTSRQCRPQLY